MSERAVRPKGELDSAKFAGIPKWLLSATADAMVAPTTVTTRQHTATYPQTAMFYATELPLDVASATCY